MTLLPWGIGLGELETGPQVHEAFSKVLVQWLGELRWYPTCAAGWLGITAIELLWQFVFDTGMLPPFWYEGKWCTVDEVGAVLLCASRDAAAISYVHACAGCGWWSALLGGR